MKLNFRSFYEVDSVDSEKRTLLLTAKFSLLKNPKWINAKTGKLMLDMPGIFSATPA